MQAERSQVSRVAFLLAGVAAGALARAWSGRRGETATLRRSIAELQARLAEHESGQESRLAAIESHLAEHEARLAGVPSTEQIVNAMQDLLGRTMHNLDQRLATQAESIDLLKTTVAQTDGLLERVLESIDALRQEESTSSDSY